MVMAITTAFVSTYFKIDIEICVTSKTILTRDNLNTKLMFQAVLAPALISGKDMQEALMLRAADASEKFKIAAEDMQGWYETYNAAMIELQSQMNNTDFMCTEPGPLANLGNLDDQIAKVRLSEYNYVLYPFHIRQYGSLQ